MLELITPSWPASNRVKAYNTTRKGGFSQGLYSSLNLGISSGDDYEIVQRNRKLLADTIQLPNEPAWLKQVHGTGGIELAGCLSNSSALDPENLVMADAAYTFQPQTVCVVLTADCLPIFICDQQATVVAAIHAGWKGLAAGVIEATIEKIKIPGKDLLAWIGPGIGPNAFEVGEEVVAQFTQIDPAAQQAFQPHKPQKWLGNLYLLARQRLAEYGVHQIFSGDFCTYTDSERFFSYRRDGQKSGRMASVIWLEK